mmetsp:Transcript_16080/g.44533  ORF Transcript_16080/g.44533 Transcript_16080/m.44533 type:complete len:231 (-) Transcript_16080:161-853(-)
MSTGTSAMAYSSWTSSIPLEQHIFLNPRSQHTFGDSQSKLEKQLSSVVDFSIFLAKLPNGELLLLLGWSSCLTCCCRFIWRSRSICATCACRSMNSIGVMGFRPNFSREAFFWSKACWFSGASATPSFGDDEKRWVAERDAAIGCCCCRKASAGVARDMATIAAVTSADRMRRRGLICCVCVILRECCVVFAVLAVGGWMWCSVACRLSVVGCRCWGALRCVEVFADCVL